MPTIIMDLLQDLFSTSDELQPALFCGDVQEELPSLGRSKCSSVSHSELINIMPGMASKSFSPAKLICVHAQLH